MKFNSFIVDIYRGFMTVIASINTNNYQTVGSKDDPKDHSCDILIGLPKDAKVIYDPASPDRVSIITSSPLKFRDKYGRRYEVDPYIVIGDLGSTLRKTVASEVQINILAAGDKLSVSMKSLPARFLDTEALMEDSRSLKITSNNGRNDECFYLRDFIFQGIVLGNRDMNEYLTKKISASCSFDRGRGISELSGYVGGIDLRGGRVQSSLCWPPVHESRMEIHDRDINYEDFMKICAEKKRAHDWSNIVYCSGGGIAAYGSDFSVSIKPKEGISYKIMLMSYDHVFHRINDKNIHTGKNAEAIISFPAMAGNFKDHVSLIVYEGSAQVVWSSAIDEEDAKAYVFPALPYDIEIDGSKTYRSSDPALLKNEFLERTIYPDEALAGFIRENILNMNNIKKYIKVGPDNINLKFPIFLDNLISIGTMEFNLPRRFADSIPADKIYDTEFIAAKAANSCFSIGINLNKNIVIDALLANNKTAEPIKISIEEYLNIFIDNNAVEYGSIRNLILDDIKTGSVIRLENMPNQGKCVFSYCNNKKEMTKIDISRKTIEDMFNDPTSMIVSDSHILISRVLSCILQFIKKESSAD